MTVNVTDEFVTSLSKSVRSILKLKVPASVWSVVPMTMSVVGLQVSHGTHASVATFLTV